MEKILMHEVISRAMGTLSYDKERAAQQCAWYAMDGVKYLIKTRRAISQAKQAAVNAAEEVDCGLYGNRDAGGSMFEPDKCPAFQDGWLIKRLKKALEMELPLELREVIIADLATRENK